MPPRSTTVRARSTTPAGRRAAVRDFSATSQPSVEWDVRAAYDVLFSLAEESGSTDDLLAEDRRWLAEARRELRERVDLARPDVDGGYLAVLAAELLVDRPDVRRARDVAGLIAAASTRELYRGIVCDFVRDPAVGTLIDRLVDGDRGAIDGLRATLPEWKPEIEAIFADPAGSHAWLREAVGFWATRFEAIEDRVEAILERDVELRGDGRGVPVQDLIEATTGGFRWLPDATTRRVVLAPSYFSRPYNFLLAGPDWRLFGYPVADAALDATDPLAPPSSTVRLHRALGDETRLRILKLLARDDLYLTEIAQQLDLSKPTIKHHLALLRAAGLVTIVESGAVTYYALRRDRLDDASADLKRFLRA